MGLFSNLFSKEKKLEELRSPQAVQLGNDYLSSIQRGLAGYTPGQQYPNSLSIPLTSYEQDSFGKLGQYLDSSLIGNEAYDLGKNQLMGTVRGDYNPITSPTYKAFKAELQSSKDKSIEEARRRAGMSGGLSTTGSRRVEGDIGSDYNNRLASTLAGLYENERQRQLNAAPQLLNLAEAENLYPVQQAQYAQQLGGLSRINDIANLEREYNAWASSRNEQSNALNQAGQASNFGSPALGVSSYSQPTVFGSLLSSAIPALAYGAGAGMFSGGGALSRFFNPVASGGAGVGASGTFRL